MTTKVLVGIDGTSTAADAAHTAAGLAHALGARLCVISAFTSGAVERVGVGTDVFVLSNETQAQSVVQDEAGKLRAAFPGLEIETMVTEGKPADTMVRVAQQVGADLIVVGNKRVQGPARMLGSIAADVAHRAHCDVYVAHTHVR